MMDEKIYNKEYNVFYKHFAYQKACGLWLKNPLLIALRMIFQNTITVSCFMHFLTADRKKGYTTDFLDDCAVGVSICGMNFSIVCFIKNRQVMLELVEKMNVFKLFGKPASFDKVNIFQMKFLKYYKHFVTLGVLSYCFSGLFEKSSCIKEKIHDGKQKICGILAQTVYFEGVDDFPLNEVVFLLHAISAIMSTHSAGAIYSIVLAVCENIIVRVDHLIVTLQKLDELPTREMKHLHLRNCIMYHNDIISIADAANKCFSSILFAAISLDTLIMGILSVQLLINPSFPVFTHILAWAGTLLVLSITGQRLHDKAISVQHCIYGLQWYNECPAVQKDLNFIVFRCQYPLMLCTGAFGYMSLSTYLKVMKTSYSYVAVIQQRL